MALNKQTLAEQIYSILREDILSQKIKRGEKLTLKVLQERFQVSSTPVREALTRLVQDQLITYYSNVGVRVIDPSPEDIRQIYTFMGDLDALAIRYASEYPDQEKILSAVSDILSSSREALNEQNFSLWNQYSDQFHLIFYDFCRNRHLKDSAEQLRSRLTIFSRQYSRNLSAEEPIQTEHEAIFHAYEKREVENATTLMRQHLQHSLQYALDSFTES